MDSLQWPITTELSASLLHERPVLHAADLSQLVVNGVIQAALSRTSRMNELVIISVFMPCAFLRCSFLFSAAVEWKLHPAEGVESEVCRSRLQLFGLAGGASRTDLRGSVTHTVSYLLHGPKNQK